MGVSGYATPILTRVEVGPSRRATARQAIFSGHRAHVFAAGPARWKERPAHAFHSRREAQPATKNRLLYQELRQLRWCPASRCRRRSKPSRRPTIGRRALRVAFDAVVGRCFWAGTSGARCFRRGCNRSSGRSGSVAHFEASEQQRPARTGVHLPVELLRHAGRRCGRGSSNKPPGRSSSSISRRHRAQWYQRVRDVVYRGRRGFNPLGTYADPDVGPDTGFRLRGPSAVVLSASCSACTGTTPSQHGWSFIDAGLLGWVPLVGKMRRNLALSPLLRDVRDAAFQAAINIMDGLHARLAEASQSARIRAAGGEDVLPARYARGAAVGSRR